MDKTNEIDSTPPTKTNSSDQATKPYSRNWKKWVPVYLIIAALLYGGLYYFVLNKQSSPPAPISKITSSPTTDVTAGWKTHTSNRLGILFKYPSSWQVNELAEFTSLSISNYPFNKYHQIASAEKPYEKGDYMMSIEEELGHQGAKNPEDLLGVFESQKDPEGNYYHELTSYNYLTKRDETKRNTYILKNQKIISVNKYDALYREEGKTPIIYIFDGKEKTIKARGDLLERDTGTFMQILSTFKFTDQDDNTSNWKTHTDDKYGFTIKYPSNKYVYCPIEGNKDFFLFKGSDATKDCYLGEQPTEMYIRERVGKETPKDVTCRDYKKEDIAIDGVPAIKYTSGKSNNNPSSECPVKEFGSENKVSIYLDHGGNQLEIYIDETSDKETKNQILSTLNFTN